MRAVHLSPGMLHPRMICLWSRREKILISPLAALFFNPSSSIDLIGFLQIWDGSLSFKALLRVVQETAGWQKIRREKSCKASLTQWRVRMTKSRLWSLRDENSTYTVFHFTWCSLMSLKAAILNKEAMFNTEIAFPSCLVKLNPNSSFPSIECSICSYIITWNGSSFQLAYKKE